MLQRGIQNDLGISYRFRVTFTRSQREVSRGVMCPHPPWGDLLGKPRACEAQWGEVGSSSGSWLDPWDGQRHRGPCLPVLGWMQRPSFLESGAVWISQLHMGEVPIALGVPGSALSTPSAHAQEQGAVAFSWCEASALPPGGCTQPLPANAHHCGLGKGTSESGA